LQLLIFANEVVEAREVTQFLGFRFLKNQFQMISETSRLFVNRKLHEKQNEKILLVPEILVSAVCSYLRNNSGKLANFSSRETKMILVQFAFFVMDTVRHVPLYKALLLLLRSVASCPLLVPLLLP
jgi:hypothetical protein